MKNDAISRRKESGRGIQKRNVSHFSRVGYSRGPSYIYSAFAHCMQQQASTVTAVAAAIGNRDAICFIPRSLSLPDDLDSSLFHPVSYAAK